MKPPFLDALDEDVSLFDGPDDDDESDLESSVTCDCMSPRLCARRLTGRCADDEHIGGSEAEDIRELTGDLDFNTSIHMDYFDD